MTKPYIVCHMMSSVDGRIDCAMTEQLQGTKEYYDALAQLNASTSVSGRVTAELEMALPGHFESDDTEPFGKEGVSKKVTAKGYTVVVDTHGTLLWDEDSTEAPLIIVTSEQVSKAYLAYLDKQNISWIVCGKDHIDLQKACQVLAETFGVERMTVLGGPRINAGFLEAGLLDEVSLVIDPGIDGRVGMLGVFDGFSAEKKVTPLMFGSVQPYGDGAVWLCYRVN